MSVGRYKGIEYRRQRECDVFYGINRKSFVWVAYQYGVPTGDTFRTKAEFIQAVDAGHFDVHG